MRLTLRTLLSYLDDTLEPAEAKTIGAKVAESEQARELTDRIKQVTRRRRLTTPPASGPGGMDANTIAEYLDNDVTPEKSAEVEQICLASDVHLAEVAACHQILTLVLGEPALVPPTAKQRMYTLVKGPESIPFRKPPRPTNKDDQDLSSELEPDQDDTLRLGVPAVGKGGIDQRNLILMIGGGALAALLLAVAVWQFMKPATNVLDKKPDEIAQAELEKKAQEAKDKVIQEAKDKVIQEAKDKVIQDAKDKAIQDAKEKKKKPEENKLPDFKTVEVPPPKDPERPVFQPASTNELLIGTYVQPPFRKPKDSIVQLAETASVLVQKSDKGWTRIAGKDARIRSGQPLVSLPGSKSVVALNSGIELTLWGNLPELTQDGTVLESRAIMHVPAAPLDADVTLERGRIILRNRKADGKDAQVRVRFFNSMPPKEKPKDADKVKEKDLDKELYKGKEEVFDIILQGKDAAVILDRIGLWDPADEPFYENRNDPLRLGPSAVVKIYPYEHSANVGAGAVWQVISDKNTQILQWTSREANLAPAKSQKLPPWFHGIPDLKDPGLKLNREKFVNAHLALAKAMDTKENVENRIYHDLEVLKEEANKNAQKEMNKAKGAMPSADTFAQWRFGVRCSASVDALAELYDEFARNETPIFVRGMDMEALRQWVTWTRDSDYELLAVVQAYHNNKKTAAENIMHLFHMIPEDEFRKPERYKSLIEGLDNPLLPIRTLSHWHLLFHEPEDGFKIQYDPSPAFWPADRRAEAMRRWKILIETPAKKKKGS